jgi:RHS repeat-associated protein
MGNRTMKLTKPRNTDGTYQGEENWIYTWYVRDAQGNVMCTYQQTLAFERSAPNGNIYREKLRAIEWPIYGSSRLGIHETHELDAEISASSFHSGGKDAEGKYIRKLYIAEEQQNGGGVGVGFVGGNGGFTPPNYRGKSKSFYAGLKKYELSNHLGNVMSVVTDRKTVKFNEFILIEELGPDTYQPDVISATDYYPGGSIMPGRSFNANSYRFGYQGSEKDDEISGVGNSFTTFYRQGDTRLLRWWSVDPKSGAQPWQSPYNYMDGNPAMLNDPKGDCPDCGPSLYVWYVSMKAKYTPMIKKVREPTQRMLVRSTSNTVPDFVPMNQSAKKYSKLAANLADANQIIDGTGNLATEATKDVGQTLDDFGSAVSDGGLVAAPFTGGASLGVLPVGAAISAAGKGLKAIANAAEGDYKSGAGELVDLAIGYLINKSISKAVSQSNLVGNIVKDTKEAIIQETVLEATGNAATKAANIVTDEAINN